VNARVEIVIEDRRWFACRGLRPLLKCACRSALASAGRRDSKIELAVLLAGNEELARLNAQFRGRKGPTDVLSFPSLRGGPHIGDIAIAYGVCAGAARERSLGLAEHAAHLAVHGVLHLLGFDHVVAREARRMEALEVSVLAALKIDNPYRPRSNAA